MFTQRLSKELREKRISGLFREPPEVVHKNGRLITLGSRELVNFSSNDYLGLGASAKLAVKVSRNFAKYGPSSSSSRLVCGNFSLISEAEKAFAKYFGYQDAVFFSSGFLANLALVSTLFRKGDHLVFDKHLHASTIKGIMLSTANFYGYNHGDLDHLGKRLLSIKSKKKAVLTESLFSMDGDIPDMDNLAGLKTEHGFLLVVDEAHAFGALGKKGRGLAGNVADFSVGTFGKALGLFGAFVLMPSGYKEYFMNYSIPLIYSTALPEAHAASALDILEIIESADGERKSLADISSLMKKSITANGFTVKGDAHILAIEVGDEAKASALAQVMRQDGYFILAARYPTVPLGKAILRIGMSALHTEDDVKKFNESLARNREKIQ